VHYGAGSVYGYRSKDKVCVESNSDDFACTLNLQMLAVTRTSMLDGMQADGIVGLAPVSNTAEDQTGGTSIIQVLYDERKIN